MSIIFPSQWRLDLLDYQILMHQSTEKFLDYIIVISMVVADVAVDEDMVIPEEDVAKEVAMVVVVPAPITMDQRMNHLEW